MVQHLRGAAGAVAVLVVTLAAGCAGPAPPAATAQRPVTVAPPAPGQALVHVHEFPPTGRRLDPPTGRPKLGWERAVRSGTVRGFFRADPPVEVRLADYTSRFHDPVRRVLVWVAVDPEHPELRIGGPDFGPGYAGPSRCPLYVVVDATSGRGYGAWQACDPPYRG